MKQIKNMIKQHIFTQIQIQSHDCKEKMLRDRIVSEILLLIIIYDEIRNGVTVAKSVQVLKKKIQNRDINKKPFHFKHVFVFIFLMVVDLSYPLYE